MGMKEILKSRITQMFVFVFLIISYIIWERLKYGFWDFILIIVVLFVSILLAVKIRRKTNV